MEIKCKSKHVEDWQEYQVVRMYKKGRMIKDISTSTHLSRNLVCKVLDAHGIRKPYAPAEAKKRKHEVMKGTAIQQCAYGINERHKRLNQLFKPTMTA